MNTNFKAIRLTRLGIEPSLPILRQTLCPIGYCYSFADAKAEVDDRDVQRLMSDDEYAALFVQWSKKEEDAPKLVLKCLKWRLQNKINGKIENVW